jgi:hypothetical protein
MRMKIIAGAVVALLVAGAGAALVEAASNMTPPTRQTTTNEIDTKTLLSFSEAVQNPLVNPGAAGTQTGWQGYGASSAATAEQSGTSTPGAVTPGAGRITGPGSVSPTAGQALTSAQARSRLRKLGYSWITDLRRIGNSNWQAGARKGHSQMQVQLDANGNVVDERQATR